jgi:hypothetical protein
VESLTGTVTLTPAVGLTNPITLTCSNLPYAYSCVFGSSTFTSDGSGTPFTTSVILQYTAPMERTRAIPTFSIAGLLLVCACAFKRRSRALILLSSLVLCATLVALSGCGKGPITSANSATYPVSITGTSGVISHTATITLHLQQ